VPPQAHARRAGVMSGSASAMRWKQPASALRERDRACVDQRKVTVYTGATRRANRTRPRSPSIAADHLGVTPDDITIVTGDTAATALGIGSFAAPHGGQCGILRPSRRTGALAQDQAIRRRYDGGGRRGHRAGGQPCQIAGSDIKRSFREIAVRAVGMPGNSMAGGRRPAWRRAATSRQINQPIPTALMWPRSRSISRPAT